jgi:hypothetical protein
MPEKAMCKVKNVSGSDRTLDGRQVVAGAVIEVPEDAVYGLTCQEPNWKPADKATQKVHDEAHAAQVEANKPGLPPAGWLPPAPELVQVPTSEKEND